MECIEILRESAFRGAARVVPQWKPHLPGWQLETTCSKDMRREVSTTRCFRARVNRARNMPKCSRSWPRWRRPQFEERRQARRPFLSYPGHHLHRVQRRPRHGAAFPVRPDSPHHSATRNGSASSAAWRSACMALNLFLQDVYGKQRIFEGPPDSALAGLFLQAFPARNDRASKSPRGIHTHICGIDLVRDSKTGEFFVLEDNVRTPSGISYVLENRLVMTRTFPDAFQACEVLPVNHYPAELSRILRSLSPRGGDDAQIVLLTPGIYNSAYFEHSFLAQQMGIELVEGRDLIVDGGIVYMKTIHGLKRVDVIYRRVDDDFLDSLAFRPDSLLGVPGLMGAYRAGNVALANAVGNGVADDKAIYAYVPDVYPLLPRRRPDPANRGNLSLLEAGGPLVTCSDHLPELVVKAVGESGGYGMLMGPTSDQRAPRRIRRANHRRSAQLHRAAGDCRFRACLPTIRPHGASTGATWICALTACTTGKK